MKAARCPISFGWGMAASCAVVSPHHHLRVRQLLLHRQLHHVLVDEPRALFAHQLREVVQRVVVWRPVRLCQAAQVSRRRVVPNLVLRISEAHLPRRAQNHRAQQRTQLSAAGRPRS